MFYKLIFQRREERDGERQRKRETERERERGEPGLSKVFPTLVSSVAPRAGSVAWRLTGPALALVTSRGSV